MRPRSVCFVPRWSSDWTDVYHHEAGGSEELTERSIQVFIFSYTCIARFPTQHGKAPLLRKGRYDVHRLSFLSPTTSTVCEDIFKCYYIQQHVSPGLFSFSLCSISAPSPLISISIPKAELMCKWLLTCDDSSEGQELLSCCSITFYPFILLLSSDILPKGYQVLLTAAVHNVCLALLTVGYYLEHVLMMPEDLAYV